MLTWLHFCFFDQIVLCPRSDAMAVQYCGHRVRKLGHRETDLAELWRFVVTERRIGSNGPDFAAPQTKALRV